MTATKSPDNFSEVQTALYRAALAVDSFLVNGIPMGVIHQAASEDFLPALAEKYYHALNDLAQLLPQVAKTSQPAIGSLLTQAKNGFDQMHQITASLASFRSLSSQEIQSAVSDLVAARQDCINVLQELEQYFGTPEPFYQTRSRVSQNKVDRFLTNLVVLFETERKASATAR